MWYTDVNVIRIINTSCVALFIRLLGKNKQCGNSSIIYTVTKLFTTVSQLISRLSGRVWGQKLAIVVLGLFWRNWWLSLFATLSLFVTASVAFFMRVAICNRNRQRTGVTSFLHLPIDMLSGFQCFVRQFHLHVILPLPYYMEVSIRSRSTLFNYQDFNKIGKNTVTTKPLI